MNSDELIEKNLSLNVGLDWSWKEKNHEPKQTFRSWICNWPGYKI